MLVDRKVPTRRVSFDEAVKDIPRYFAADEDLILSHLITVLSGVFPDGEDFFVRSVRHFRSQITDPELKQDVAGFIGQEAIHGREHRILNRRFDELGFNTARLERLVKKSFKFRERIMSPESNLAATAALEHFTATLAELVLTKPEVRALFGHPVVVDFLIWHALEESEHKAVAFDVYRAVGGTEKMRINTMNFVTVAFMCSIGINTVISLLGDRRTYRRGVLRSSFKRFKSSPIISRNVWEALRAYNQTGFHPNDFESSEMIAKWRAELFGASGRLNVLLKSGV